MEDTKIQKGSSPREWIDLIGLFLGWFSIVGQFVLTIENRQVAVFETIIRFFSFFTILTNLLVVPFILLPESLYSKKFLFGK